MVACGAVVLFVGGFVALVQGIDDAMKDYDSCGSLPTPNPTIPTKPTIPTRTEVYYRLPLNIKPISYEITLTPFLTESDAENFTFRGECKIKIQALQTTKQIQLHIGNLNISLGVYYKENAIQAQYLPEATPNNLTDIVVYNLNEELQANVSYILHYKYFGSINKEKRGFYRSKYTTTNAVKWVGATEFEPIHAREAFPSFDEPNFKANFSLCLVHDNLFNSLGPTEYFTLNTTNYKKVYFKETSKMSTFALTFTVSEFYIEHEHNLGVAARPEYSSQTTFSKVCYFLIFQLFKRYFAIDVDIIHNNVLQLHADPYSEFGESLLLFDPKKGSVRSKQYVLNTVAFKVARLYWGTLVTCKWWGNVWLNVGFATYFQYVGSDLYDGDFQMQSQFVVDVLQLVMIDDATDNTRPMSNNNIRTKQDIMGMFNRISYLKAAAFIRMTKDILGEPEFKKSLNEYLITYAYKNTIPSDLFNIWKKYWPIKHYQFHQKYFYSFTNQVGYPLVTFKRASDYSVEVSQQRFLLKGFKIANSYLTYTVPITFTTSFDTNFEDLSTQFFLQEDPITIGFKNNNISWIIGNIQATGYYRVNYDNNSWDEIRQKLFSDSRNEIHVLNRVQIVDDLLNLARAGVIGYNLALNILQYLQKEIEYLPWAAALNGFSYIMTRLGNESNIFVPYIRGIIGYDCSFANFIPNNGHTPLKNFKRNDIFHWCCKHKIGKCVDLAKLSFDKISEPQSIALHSVVYCTVLREGSETNFNTLYNMYMAETDCSEKVLIFDSLSCVKDRKLVDMFFQIIISNDIPTADKTIALCNLCTKNNENVDYVFTLIDENIEQVATATGGYDSVASVVLETANHFTTEAQLNKLKDFNKKHTDKFGSLISKLQGAVSVVEMNLKWSRENLKEIKSVLAKIAPIES